MNIIRRLARLVGYDGTSVKRYDQIEASTLAWNSLFPLVKKLFNDQENIKQKLVIVQIGANDIQRDDPYSFIHKKNKHHKMFYIDPNPKCVAQLKRTFKKNKNINIIECAIANKNGKKTFYMFDQKHEKQIQLDVLSSLSKKQVKAHKKLLKLKSKIISKTVTTFNLESFFKRYRLNRCDVLLCDIEGLDYEVVNQVASLRFCRPSLFVYEHHLISRGQRESGYRQLQRSGFAVVAGAYDSLAINLHG